jgi:hypothetical protein
MRIEEVSASSLSDYARYFSGAQPEMVFASVRAGNTAARLWVYSGYDSEPGVLLWDKGNNVFYLSGSLHNASEMMTLGGLFTTEIQQASIKEGRMYFTVRALSSGIEVFLEKLLPNIDLHPITKFFYRFKADIPGTPVLKIEDVQFAAIDRVFLKRKDLANLDAVVMEIQQMWPSLARFYEQGFGCAALMDDLVIGWCTAEYVSDNLCGIGIETINAYTNNGVATALASRFIAVCKDLGINPYWECNSRNIPSIRVAEKVGFEKIGESIFYAGKFQ